MLKDHRMQKLLAQIVVKFFENKRKIFLDQTRNGFQVLPWSGWGSGNIIFPNSNITFTFKLSSIFNKEFPVNNITL